MPDGHGSRCDLHLGAVMNPLDYPPPNPANLRPMGDHRVIWAQFYHHEAHEEHEEHEGKNLLFKINKMPGNITRKRNLGNAFVRIQLMRRWRTK
jgi:hypothetical protein